MPHLSYTRCGSDHYMEVFISRLERGVFKNCQAKVNVGVRVPNERGEGRTYDPTHVQGYEWTHEWTVVCVRVDGRVSVRTCVDLSRPRARAKTRSTSVGVIRVCRFRCTCSVLGTFRRHENKVDPSRPIFRTSERVNARTYAHRSVHLFTHVRPLLGHTSVHFVRASWVVRASGARHVHLHPSPHVRSPRSLPLRNF